MENVVVVVLSFGVYLGTTWLCLWLFGRSLEALYSVAFGVMGQIVLSADERIRRLLSSWLLYVSGIIVVAFAGAFACWEIAGFANEGARAPTLFAYLLFLWGAGGLTVAVAISVSMTRRVRAGLYGFRGPDAGPPASRWLGTQAPPAS
ncbi:MAG: hypothetical protein AAF500_15180 [Myxococcota bacterium]